MTSDSSNRSAGERTCLTVILAAGEGKRMASDMPKVLHPVAGLPMVNHVLATCMEAGGNARAVVVGNQAERVSAAVQGFDPDATIHEQKVRAGTAHAVLAARDAIEQGFDDVVMLYGDVPLIRTETLQAARDQLATGQHIVVLGFETDDPHGYGRLLMDGDRLLAIREDKDATDEERAVTFCNSGIIAFSGEHVLSLLDAVENDNAQGEYYAPDTVEIGVARGLNVCAITVPEEDTLGVNDRVQLAQMEALWQRRRREAFLRNGVTMQVPESVVLHHDTVVERDVVIEPNVVFGADVTVASGAAIRAFSHLEGAHVSKNAIVGPYARLRPGTVLEEGAKIGNFVETKAARVGAGAKINHLSYFGDTEIGAKANIGAGSITCNYDGFGKHKTIVGEGAFIGTNTSLVAPVSVGKNANTAAGSVIYKDVPNDDLAIERGEQVNKTGRAVTLRAKNKATKEAQSKD
ncbi:MAG: bifunctional UDP-N-acetylglucosamine diphosphorylase/glucosamine-1-phosphate N-acetyltransferase GlmU [Pseudomonadota bacterium]